MRCMKVEIRRHEIEFALAATSSRSAQGDSSYPAETQCEKSWIDAPPDPCRSICPVGHSPIYNVNLGIQISSHYDVGTCSGGTSEQIGEQRPVRRDHKLIPRPNSAALVVKVRGRGGGVPHCPVFGPSTTQHDVTESRPWGPCDAKSSKSLSAGFGTCCK